jgi:hypothetical protein
MELANCTSGQESLNGKSSQQRLQEGNATHKSCRCQHRGALQCFRISFNTHPKESLSFCNCYQDIHQLLRTNSVPAIRTSTSCSETTVSLWHDTNSYIHPRHESGCAHQSHTVYMKQVTTRHGHQRVENSRRTLENSQVSRADSAQGKATSSTMCVMATPPRR